MENRNELYKIIPIFNSNLKDDEINNFSVRYAQAKNLVRYLYGKADAEEENNLMRTYIVRDNLSDELVGYFSLKAGMISINEQKNGDYDFFDTRPAVELANFAINNNYIKNNPESKGCGIIVFSKYIIPIIMQAAKKIGIKYVFIYSLPMQSLINRYKKYRFKRLSSKQEKELHKRLKPKYDRGCIFMYQEL